MLDEGIGALSAIEVSDALSRIGGDYEVEVGSDATTLSLTTLERFGDRAAQLLADAQAVAQAGASMVVLEAMAHGLPVLVSSAHYCGIAAELTHGSDALILDHPQDSKELARHLNTLLTNSDLRTSLKEAGLHFARERSWTHAAQRHETLMEQVRSQHRNL